MISVLAVALPRPLHAQQFTADNYLAMPHGTMSSLVIAGTEYSTLMISAAVFRNWEFFAGAFLTWDDEESVIGFSTTTYAKYMFTENATKNGGFAIAFGQGGHPGFFVLDSLGSSYKQLFAIPQLSIPLLSGQLLWDLNPGVLVNFDYGEESETAWGFSYATRMALYGVVPKSALVGEIYGTEGSTSSPAQYRIGLRWEPSDSFIAAVTWSQAFDGSPSGGFEVGIVLFSPRFACIGGCDPDEYAD
jgi:hypothetical protein